PRVSRLPGIAEFVPPGRRKMPVAFGRQAPLIPEKFISVPRPLRNKNYLRRWFLEGTGGYSASFHIYLDREKIPEKIVKLAFLLVSEK
ncbi:MAG TPA: hypothetical protein VIN67_02785, partial [Desulfobaccales bacterium]